MDKSNVGTSECCRVCLQLSEGMTSIFSSFSLVSKLMWVCQLKIAEGDGLLSNICYSCTLRLNDAFQFKELCLTSDVQLRKFGVKDSTADPAQGSFGSNDQGNRRSASNGREENTSDTDGYHHPIEVKVKIKDAWNGEQSGEDPNVGSNGVSDSEDMDTQVTESLERSVRSRDVASAGMANKENTSVKQNGVPKTYSCEICGVFFKKKTAFISHMKIHMTDEIDEVFDSANEYVSQIPPNCRIDQNPFLCSICGASYKFKESFIAHIKLHDSKTNGTSSREISNVSPKSGDQSYFCAICHASFKIKQGFIAHVRQYHGREERELDHFIPSLPVKSEPLSAFTCAVCNVSFEQKTEFTSHMLEHTMETDRDATDTESDADQQESEKEFNCAICDAVYKNRQSFVAHIRLHTVEKKFECSDCRKRFTSHSDLTRHYRCHTGEKPFRCVVCQKSFARQDHLAKHVRTHTGFKPYTCGECDFSFAEKKTLASHLRSHRGEKPYECPTCHKMFARQMNFTAHVRSHAGTKQFKCAFCDKAFLEKRGLSRHVTLHHGGEEAGGS